MKHLRIAALAALIPLCGCAALPGIASGIGAAAGVAALVPQVSAAVGVAVPVLSEIAKAGCAAQAAANAAAAIASDTHNPAWAAEFSQASTLAGYACAW